MEKLLYILEGNIPSDNTLRKLGLPVTESDVVEIAKAYIVEALRKKKLKPGKINIAKLIERTLEKMRKAHCGQYGSITSRGGNAYFCSPYFLLDAPLSFFEGVNPYYFTERKNELISSETENLLAFTSEEKVTIHRQDVDAFRKVFKQEKVCLLSFPVGSRYFRTEHLMNMFKFLDETEITAEVGRGMLKASKNGITVITTEIKPNDEIVGIINKKWRKNDGNE
jgi:hypothetical protein